MQQIAAGTAWAALGLGGRILAAGEPEVRAPLPEGDDEEYWAQIAQQFQLPTTHIYLNTGTLGLMPKPALAEIQLRMQSLAEGRNPMDESPREAVARVLGVALTSISLTHNTTESINIVAEGLPFRRGDEVILTDQEHVGNALPWLNRARRSGIKLRVLSPAPTAAATLERLEALITRRTRAIAVPHITCTTGQVLPIQEICKLARSRDIFSVIDGAHGPGMLFPQMQELGCDFYATCGHKWLGGPAGTGILYVRPEMLSVTDAIMVGAYSDCGWEITSEKQTLDSLVSTAHRFDYGTQSSPLHFGLKASIKFQEEIGFEKIRARVLELGLYLQEKLLPLPFIEMLTPTEAASRGAIISFRVKGKSLSELENFATSNRFRVRLVPESKLDAMRLSPHIHNSKTDLDKLVDALQRYMQG